MGRKETMELFPQGMAWVAYRMQLPLMLLGIVGTTFLFFIFSRIGVRQISMVQVHASVLLFSFI